MAKRLTTEEFVKRSSIIHNNRYDYTDVKYIGRKYKVIVKCPVHGRFEQVADYHLKGNGCPLCFGTPKSNTAEFIHKAKQIYGNTYDYSKVHYNGNKEKVIIICPEHGEWKVSPNNFLRGSRCPKCFGTPKQTTKQFISEAKKVHGTKYNYSKVNYNGRNKKIEIVCPIHGPFLQAPQSHLLGNGCSKCSGNYKVDKNSFINKSIENHSTEYDYSFVDFSNISEKIKIICPIHGEFFQTARYHMNGGNCPKCVGGRKLTTEDFIERSNIIHNHKYDYSKVSYKRYDCKVCIVCPEHGEFWQTPNNHIFGSGCPACPQSNLEGGVREFLTRNKIAFEQEKSFEWLKYKRKLFLDFYLPEYRLGIECQGLQHFKSIELFGGEEFYNKTVIRDEIKKKLCEEHGIAVVYFSLASIDYPYPVVETYGELLNTIKNAKH